MSHPNVGGGMSVYIFSVMCLLNVSFVMLWLNKNAWSDVHVRMGVVGTTMSANRRFGWARTAVFRSRACALNLSFSLS